MARQSKDSGTKDGAPQAVAMKSNSIRLISNELNFDFLSKGTISLTASWIVILIGIVAYFVMGGFNYGIDFRGGTLVQVRLGPNVDIAELRTTLTQANIGAFSLQAFGDKDAHEFLITLGESDEQRQEGAQSPGARVESVLRQFYPDMTIRRIESVGPKVGAELKAAAWEAIAFSLVAILAYVWLRFQWRYSIGAIVATVHDVLIVLSAFVLTQKEISLTVVAAVLTVAGYSVNDTIVVFDRIRENMRRYQKKDTLSIFNEAVNQTLSRTILTSGTTLLVIVSIYFFGGEIINDFAFALLIGVTVGTYSSIFTAAPVVFKLLNWFPIKPR